MIKGSIMVSDNKNNTYEDEKKMILAVDDEEAIIDLLKFNIEKEGYKFISATNGDEGFELAMGERPDLIILDVMLPRMDGLSVCQKLRQEKNTVPVIMLSARSEEIDKILGLEIGADDYMTKPFSTRELIARIKANLRKNDKMDAKNIGTTLESKSLVVLTDSNVKRYIRKGANQNSGSNQTDVILVEPNGDVSPDTPLIWDFESITSATAYPVDTEALTIKGGRCCFGIYVLYKRYSDQTLKYGC